MLYRTLLIATLTLTFWVGASALAAEDPAPATSAHEGKVVSISDNELVMIDEDDESHSHALTEDVKITCDGVPCQAADLKAGMRIRVSTKNAVEEAATGIEALDKQSSFQSMHEGTVVRVSGSKLVMKSKDGKQHEHTFATDAPVCCDGQACQAAELKPGMKIRVTTKTGDRQVATRIEALGKQKAFADIHEETLARIDGEMLVVKGQDGKEHTHLLAASSAVTRDGKLCKVADLRPGAKIRVTVSERTRPVVTAIEALDKDNAFANRDE